MWKSEFRQNYYQTSILPTVPPFAARISHVVADGGTWRLKWERLNVGESNGKLSPRTCPGCSVPEPYRSHDWALVPAKPGLQGWILMNEQETRKPCHMLMTMKWCCNVQWVVETPTVRSICMRVECVGQKYIVMLQKWNDRLFDVGTEEDKNAYILLLQWNGINKGRRQMCAVMCQKQNEGLYDADDRIE